MGTPSWITRLYQRDRARVELKPASLLVAMGVVFCLIVISTTVHTVCLQREDALRGASTNLTNLSLAMADKVDGLIASIEVAEGYLVEHLAFEPADMHAGMLPIENTQALHDLLRNAALGLRETYELALVNVDGMLTGLSGTFPTPSVNLVDRDYFQFARAHPEISTFISEPVISRFNGRLIFFVVRRLSSVDGSFQGVLTAAVDSSYLSRRLQALHLGKGSSISLVRRDGTMLLREPILPLEIMLAHRDEIRAQLESINEGGIRRLVGIDGVERLFSITPLPRHGVVLGISQPYAFLLHGWRNEATWLSLAAFLICCTVTATIGLALRALRNQQRIEAMQTVQQVQAGRLQAESLIAAQNACFALAVDAMGHGLMMFAHKDHLIFANAAACKVYGVQPGAFWPGMTLAEIVAVLAGVNMLTESAEAALQRCCELMQQKMPQKYIRILPDDRQLAVCFTPHGKGGLFIMEDVTELRRVDARMAHMAHHDALTGLPNRFELRRCQEQALMSVDAEPFALMCLDLDHFKAVNDTLGHPAGDKLLRDVATRIRLIIREDDTFARLGGDEFAIIIPLSKGRDAIANIADRVIKAITEPFDINGQNVYVGVSIGIALAPENGRDPDQLMQQADLALYRAKRDGRARHRFFKANMEQQATDRLRIEVEMREALTREHFVLYYQPLVSAATRRVVGYEALLRWCHPDRGMISPASFIPVAEENGMIVQIGAWALRAACQAAINWPTDLKLAVNLSPVQFLDADLVEKVQSALCASGLSPTRLELEITESTMMHDVEQAVITLTRLKELGVNIAMDDFGTGHSSLANLRRFPFDKVKIDQAFIRDIAEKHNLAILQAIIHITRSMGIRTTAEGVETEVQLAEVVAAGCDELQGYLFSKPLASDDLSTVMTRIDGQALVLNTANLADLNPFYCL